MKPRKTPPTRGLVAVVWHALLCFFIFSGQAVNAASSPLDQIPSPSASFLALLGLAGVLGAVIGAWVNPTQPDTIENVKGVARRKVDCQSEAKEGRCPPLPLPSCSKSSSLVDGITSDGCSTSADTPESTPLPELLGWPLAQLPEHEHEWPQPVPPHPIVHVSRNEIENCPLCQCIAAPTDPADSSQ